MYIVTAHVHETTLSMEITRITLAIKGKTCGFYSFLRAGHLLNTLFYIVLHTCMINIIDKMIVYLIVLAGKTF